MEEPKELEDLVERAKLKDSFGCYIGPCPLWNVDPTEYENATSIAALARRADVAERSAEWLRSKLTECQENTIPMLILRAEKAEMSRDATIKYMRKTYGWCTGCVHFTGIYGSGCKSGDMSTCTEEKDRYMFCKEE